MRTLGRARSFGNINDDPFGTFDTMTAFQFYGGRDWTGLSDDEKNMLLSNFSGAPPVVVSPNSALGQQIARSLAQGGTPQPISRDSQGNFVVTPTQLAALSSSTSSTVTTPGTVPAPVSSSNLLPIVLLVGGLFVVGMIL
jgi:hypothetical protein